MQRFLDLAGQEALGPPLLYEIAEIARTVSAGPPPMQSLIDALHDSGHAAMRCHTSPTGVKTDASWTRMVELARRM